eukprot:1271144-Rhodomonas_salina.2
MASSGMSSRCLTSARSVFPCAATITFFPDWIAGASVSLHSGMKRSTTVFKLSAFGSSSPDSAAYRRSLPDQNSWSSAISGGGVSYERRHTLTLSSPCSATVSALFSPWSAP